MLRVDCCVLNRRALVCCCLLCVYRYGLLSFVLSLSVMGCYLLCVVRLVIAVLCVLFVVVCYCVLFVLGWFFFDCCFSLFVV